MKPTAFSSRLLSWHKTIKRKLPWKSSQAPYPIWLSEIILQQTRVEQGIPYYHKIIRRFPSIVKLAEADEDEVLHAWQGLGYYSRARNLHDAAKQIMDDWKGKFPSTYEDILKLKGVGTYTAAAIASFAFNLPHAVVDGNVYRVLSRAFGITGDISKTPVKRRVHDLASKLLDPGRPAEYNQAIMDFGAMICKPVNPSCSDCFFRGGCFALRHGKVQSLPVKARKQSAKFRWFYYMVVKKGDQIALEKRTGSDIWKGLYQFPLYESPVALGLHQVLPALIEGKMVTKRAGKIPDLSPVIKHKLSHQTLMVQFIELKLSQVPRRSQSQGWKWVRRSALKNFSLPKLLFDYSKKYLA